MPGPAPKRSEQRRRTNATAHSLVKVDGAAVEIPDLGLDECHPMARSWYEALKSSPEARFFTPAVWQRVRINALVLSNALNSSKMSSMLYAAIQSDWKSLLVDPSEQRRLHIEVQAAVEVDPDEVRASATVTNLRDRLGG